MPGANIALGLAESGLTSTTDTDSVGLVVTEDFTDFASASDSASTSYANTAPIITAASGTNEVDQSITFGATFDDTDLVANVLVTGFETVDLEFLYLGTPFLVGGGNLDLPTLQSIFGGPGTFSVDALVTDFAGASAVTSFSIDVIPEPNTAALLALGLGGLAARGRRRKA